MPAIRWLFLIVFVLGYLIACSSDDGLRPSCFQEEGRRVTVSVSNRTGTVIAPDSDNPLSCNTIYVIEYDGTIESFSIGLLWSCNLPEELKEDGTRVVFDGYAFETFETENICAHFFEFTQIDVIEE